MKRRKRNIPPAKKRYALRNPTVSIVLTEKSGLKEYINYWKYVFPKKSYGEIVKQILMMHYHENKERIKNHKGYQNYLISKKIRQKN